MQIQIAKIKKSNTLFLPDEDEEVTVKKTGAITEIRNMGHTNLQCPIVKLDVDNYILKETGELLPFKKTNVRSESPERVKQSLHHLRDILNANCEDVKRCKWLTLTYAENMADTTQLYEDFRRFHQRLSYHVKKQYGVKYEYIGCAEPQGRGAWHLHIVLIFEKKAPFISNDTVAEIWGRGFTKTKNLDNSDNVGLYLTAYLADMDIESSLQGNSSYLKGKPIQQKGNKAFIKGSRLHLYPKGFRLYRTSRGVKQPLIMKTTEKHAQSLVKGQPLVYEKTVDIVGEDDSIINRIHYRQYNKNRLK